jgi:hypothetical protein
MGKIFQRFRDCLYGLEIFRKPESRKKFGLEVAVRHATMYLTELSIMMQWLSILVDHSPTFHMHLTNPAIDEWFYCRSVDRNAGDILTEVSYPTLRVFFNRVNQFDHAFHTVLWL